ncbi:MAG: HAD-IA family hydrolase [Clostridia bacterium]
MKSLNKIQYVLFDLDGTITDSAEGITKSAQLALESIGIIEDREVLRSFIGPSLRESFGRYAKTPELVSKALTAYRARYEFVGIYENKLYDGIYELLRDLKQSGKKVVLASAKPEPFCRLILDYFKITEFFEFIGGSTFDGKMDDKANILKYIFEGLGNPDKSEIIMVGDRKYDIVAAHQNDIQAIGVRYGYAVDGELENARADFIVYSTNELRNLLLN